jgi:hypothetical protein
VDTATVAALISAIPATVAAIAALVAAIATWRNGRRLETIKHQTDGQLSRLMDHLTASRREVARLEEEYHAEIARRSRVKRRRKPYTAADERAEP